MTRLYAAQDGAGVPYANATIQSSDRRIKKHITDLAVGLDYVRRLRPVRYLKKHPNEYPQDLQDKFYPNGQLRKIDAAECDIPQVGVIAQEVQAADVHFGVENNIVTIDENGFDRMEYEKLVVPVVRGYRSGIRWSRNSRPRYSSAMQWCRNSRRSSRHNRRNWRRCPPDWRP